MAQVQSSEIQMVVEEALAKNRPFADKTYIFEQLQLNLERRLNRIASRLPIVAELLDAFHLADADSVFHLVGNTVVRCAILHAYAQLETGVARGLPIADCEKVFAATARRMQEGKFGMPLDDGSLPRLGPKSYHGWIWSEESPNNIFNRSFRHLLEERYGAIPCTPTYDEVAMLEKGAQLAEDLLPLLAPSVFHHAHVIALVPDAGAWRGSASSSQFHLGGTIFLGRHLRNPWWVAEHLVHESLHQKLYDFRHGHSLLELDYVNRDAPKVLSPWNSSQFKNANVWDVHRVLAAFHVYVQLALLCMVAERRAPELEDTYGPFTGMTKSSKALERAQYLGEQLRERCWDHLGLAGKKLVDWLTSVLQIVDPSPPPKGAYVHLYLDLYEREANQVAAALRSAEALPTSLPQSLIPLAKEEIEATRQLLSAIDARHELSRFNDTVAQFEDKELGLRFPELRGIIAVALMDASPTRYRLNESGSHDELLKQMITKYSHRVNSVVTGYPPAIADAKQRASDLRFAQSCEDHVGRVLAVLSATVPPGGRILEIGTGAGVGTAWITAGLGEGTDVEVMSVEIDLRLSDAVRTWPWPPCVHIVTADALELLGKIGTFNLVFADAAPVKYGNIGRVLRILRPGGLLLVDDLENSSVKSEEQRAERDALRHSLLHNPELQAVEIEWSTGLILGVRPAQLNGPSPISVGERPSVPTGIDGLARHVPASGDDMPKSGPRRPSPPSL